MTNARTAADMVDHRTLTDFKAANVYGAVAEAYTWCVGKKSGIGTTGTIDTIDFVITNESDASVIADFASIILFNARNISKTKQSNQEFKTIAQLWSENPGLEDTLIVEESVDPDRPVYSVGSPKSRGLSQFYSS